MKKEEGTRKREDERQKTKDGRWENIFWIAFFCSTSLSRGNQVGGLPRALILGQIELVRQIGGSATIDDIFKKIEENVIRGHRISHFILIIYLS